ncbi:MAG: hypothetical protein C4334_14435 [Pyrinomonas sp.]
MKSLRSGAEPTLSNRRRGLRNLRLQSWLARDAAARDESARSFGHRVRGTFCARRSWLSPSARHMPL